MSPPYADGTRFSDRPISSFLDPAWERKLVLPSYGPGFSGENPLRTSHCAGALQTSTLKARLITLEITRVKHHRIVDSLTGDARQLDMLLAPVQKDLSESDIRCPAPTGLINLWEAAMQIVVHQSEGQ